MEILEKRAYSADQIYAYERYWDAISADKTRFNSGYRTGHEVGHAEGRAEGLVEGEHKKALQIAEKMKRAAMAPQDIAALTGLPIDEIEQLA